MSQSTLIFFQASWISLCNIYKQIQNFVTCIFYLVSASDNINSNLHFRYSVSNYQSPSLMHYLCCCYAHQFRVLICYLTCSMLASDSILNPLLCILKINPPHQIFDIDLKSREYNVFDVQNPVLNLLTAWKNPTWRIWKCEIQIYLNLVKTHRIKNYGANIYQ